MTNTEFELGGLCHLALVCEDMEKTVDFYTNVLGMKLGKTIEMGNGGQHFFFDIGCNEFIAFFWFPDAPKRAPGIASAAHLPGIDDFATAHGSMNHVAIKIPLDKFDEYKAKLDAKGVVTGPVLNHDDSPRGVSEYTTAEKGVFVRSMYFFGPDGELLEFAAWTRDLTPEDVKHDPVNKDGVRVPMPAAVNA
jgi:catechol 2,3-dioxygenase-like lactoylglutathione lyase family enzyme